VNEWIVGLTWAIFVPTYAGLARGKAPGLRMDRAGIALVGAIPAQAVPEATRETAWLALAMSSTFAGNLTVLGSVAHLIVVEGARSRSGNIARSAFR
jgi:hypothetical protein